jgi:GNAT superfamily N-acetyltransferase
MIPTADAEQLATVDYHDTMAIVALARSSNVEEIIGVARYGVGDKSKPHPADATIVVNDGYQSRGLGTLLLRRLTDYAESQGIQYSIANVDSINTTMLKLVQRANLSTGVKLKAGVWDIRIQLAE